MNYRHAFHAGNFADVVKHVALALCLERLNQKPAPWRFIDTHAGVGLYDLTGEEAARSPEWREGAERVLAQLNQAPEDVRAALAPWTRTVEAVNAPGRLEFYPGSPRVALAFAREEDALRLCELHEPSCLELRGNVGDRRVKSEVRDGYEALPAFLPPPERRGVVLLDPPFEAGRADRKSDYANMLKAARRAVGRWPQGIYLFWRPLKDLDAVEAFDGELATMLIEELGVAPEKVLAVDLWVAEPGLAGPLAGAGLIIVNPPFGVEDRLRSCLSWLAQTMARDPSSAGFRLARADAAHIPGEEEADGEADGAGADPQRA